MMTIVMEPIPVLRFAPRADLGLERALEPAERAAGRLADCVSGTLDLPALATWVRSAPVSAAGELATLAGAGAAFLALWTYL